MASNLSWVSVRQGARLMEEAGQVIQVSDDIDVPDDMDCWEKPTTVFPCVKNAFNDDIKFDARRDAMLRRQSSMEDELRRKESFDSDSQKGPSPPDDKPATSMDAQLYRSATTGDIDAFTKASNDTEYSPFEQVSPRGNTVLHLAASSGHDPLVQVILQQCPDLIKRINNKGDLALHVAASGGHLATVKSLVLFSKTLAAGSNCTNPGEGETGFNVLKRVNKEGKTALFVALENRHQEVAEFLIKADPIVSHYQDSQKRSPLCMAAQAGYLELIKLMMAEKPAGGGGNPNEKLKSKLNDEFFLGDMPDELVRIDHPHGLVRSENLTEKMKGNLLLHAAIIGRNRDVLDAIWSNNPTLINSIDEEGRSPLSFAAYIDYLDGVRYLLDKSTDGAYQRDRINGFCPIHTAASMGHIEIVQEFLKRLPDSRELLDQKGRNILHVAARFGKAKMVSYMLKICELEMLIDERDNRGNTPLHLATMNWQPKVVSVLIWDKRVNLEIMRYDGLTAMDVAENYIEAMAPFRERLTLTALKSANAPRSRDKSAIKDNPNRFSSSQPPNMEQFKERVNILLLVSTLVATVTFAAGFTLPGGNNDSGPDEGMATLVKNRIFQAFLICNTIATYSSIIVVISLIFAQLGDLNLILTSLKLALPLLGVALAMVSLTFTAGVYLAVSNVNWLANVVLIMGSIFLITLLALFIPLFSPISSSHYIARYIFYYPFRLMIWATGSDMDDKKE
ncbi:hypothetical protein L1049_023405 [Liquidambar formosana]|uniref:PGG domain-containing protein n=1 Tax=Liquidambar formosana TaxID=63359 RepID=A0AAP0RY50_LIQFO